jgi:hypothetical protein
MSDPGSGAPEAEPTPGPGADSPGADSAEVPVCPDGDRYAVERWLELTDPDTPWWAMPTGVGLRLQLNEIRQLSVALQEGKVLTGAVKRLLEEARETFTADGRYAPEAFPEIRENLRRALRERDASDLLPGGAAIAAVEAAQAHLEDIGVIGRLGEDLAEAADRADDLEGLLVVDERITLLDAELAFEGYSRERRSKAAEACRGHLADGKTLTLSIETVISDMGSGNEIYEALVPLKRFDADSEVVLRGAMITGEEAEERVAEWTDGEHLLKELDEAVAVLRISDIKACDFDAAAAMARDALARHVSLWELQGVELLLGTHLLLRRGAGSAERRSVADRGIRLSGLKSYEAARKKKKDDIAMRRITDALEQLAQARTGSHGASLADLWTVSETLFGGLAADKSAEVSEQLAAIVEYLYVRDLLGWLGSRLNPDEVDLDGLARKGGSDGEWALTCVRLRVKSLPGRLIEADRPLEWVRFGQLQRWDEMLKTPKDKCHLQHDLDDIRGRILAVSNRAYLVRNLFLHQGDPQRAAAMAVTLPIFASVLRAVVGYIIREAGDGRLPLVQSELARLKVRHVAATYAANPGRGPRPLNSFIDLSDD